MNEFCSTFPGSGETFATYLKIFFPRSIFIRENLERRGAEDRTYNLAGTPEEARTTMARPKFLLNFKEKPLCPLNSPPPSPASS